MSSTAVTAEIRRTPQPLTVDGLIGAADTPGNVGLCLSGGGSRALSAAMGQLRGLRRLQANGQSLLSQVKALSTVSGGSWAGVPFCYLQGQLRDEDYLGAYVEPEQLVPTRGPDSGADEALAELREGCIGQVPADRGFGPLALVVQLAVLQHVLEVPSHLQWSVLVGSHLLSPYGLFTDWQKARGQPASLFSLDQETVDRTVLADNPELAQVPAYLYADRLDPARIRRPFLICNGALFLEQRQTDFRFLAPVQMTPLGCGVLGAPEGVDANGKRPGGGWVTPFGFAGKPLLHRGGKVVVEQSRPFALADAIGISSAFYAEALQNFIARLRDDPTLQDKLQSEAAPALERWLPEGGADKLSSLGTRALASLGSGPLASWLDEIDDLIPAYRYYPIDESATVGQTERIGFADAGSLDNTGIASLLAYADIDSLIAFVNPPKRLSEAEHGVHDADGQEIADSRIFIDDQIPPLFGYQAYREGIGYRLYAGDPRPVQPQQAHNQVFESCAFVQLLQALWQASHDPEHPGEHARPAIAKLELRVLRNDWFAVRGRGGPDDSNRRPVTLVLAYLARVRAFYDRLRPEVQALLGDFSDAESLGSYPHYSTADTYLGATKVNLLAHLTSWCVADPENAEIFRSLFTR